MSPKPIDGAPPQRGSRCRRICAPSSSKGCGAETRPRQSRSWNRRSPALPAQASAGRPSRHPGGSSGVDECVVDAAAVVDALAGKGASAIVLRGLLKESISNAPHLLDAEVGHALRRAVLSDEISEEQARAALDALPYLIDNRYPHSPRLIEYTWQLRPQRHVLRRPLRRTGHRTGCPAAHGRLAACGRAGPSVRNQTRSVTSLCGTPMAPS